MGSEMLDACQEMDRMEDYLRYSYLELRVRSTSSSETLKSKRTLSSSDRLYPYNYHLEGSFLLMPSLPHKHVQILYSLWSL